MEANGVIKRCALFFIFTLVSVGSLYLEATQGGQGSVPQPTAQKRIPANTSILTGVYVDESGHFYDADGTELTGLQYGPLPEGVQDPRFPTPQELTSAPPATAEPGMKDKFISAFKKAAWGKDLTTEEKAMVATLYSTIDTINALNQLLEPIRNERVAPPGGWDVAAFIATTAYGARTSTPKKSLIQALRDELQQNYNREFAKSVVTHLMDVTRGYLTSAVAGYNTGRVNAGDTFKSAAKTADLAATSFGVLERIVKGETRWYDRALFWFVKKVRNVSDWMRTKVYKRSGVLDTQSQDLITLAVENSDLIARAAQSVPYVGRVVEVTQGGVAAVRRAGEMVSYVVTNPSEALGEAWTGASEGTQVWLVQKVYDPVRGWISNVSQYTGDTIEAAKAKAEAAQERGIQAYNSAVEKGAHLWEGMKDAGTAVQEGAAHYAARGMAFIERISPRTAGALQWLGSGVASIAANLTFDSAGVAFGLGFTDVAPDDMPAPALATEPQENIIKRAWEEEKEFQAFFERIEKELGGDVMTHQKLIQFISQQESKKAAIEALTPETIRTFDAETLHALLTLFDEVTLYSLSEEALTELEYEVEQKLSGHTDLEAIKKTLENVREEKGETYEDAEAFNNPAAEELSQKIKGANWDDIQKLADEIIKFDEDDERELIKMLNDRLKQLGQKETLRMDAIEQMANATTLEELDTAKKLAAQNGLKIANDPILEKAYKNHQMELVTKQINATTTIEALTDIAISAQKYGMETSQISGSPLSKALLSRHGEIINAIRAGQPVQPRVTTASGTTTNPDGGDQGHQGGTSGNTQSGDQPLPNRYPLPPYSPTEGAPTGEIYPKGANESEEEYEERKARQERELQEQEVAYRAYQDHERQVRENEAAQEKAHQEELHEARPKEEVPK